MMYPRWAQNWSRADFLKSVGLYVLPDRLFLVRLRKTLLRVSVVEEQTAEILLGDDPDSRRQALSDAFRSVLRHFNPSKDPFYICLSPDRTLGLQLVLPRVAEENLSQVLEYEIERQIPFRREEVYYDFVPLGRKGDKIELFLFAVPKKHLDEILDTLSTLGVKPKGVETTTTALSNYLLYCTGGITGTALVLGGQNQAWEIIGLQARANGRREEPEILFSHWLPQADWIQGPARDIFHNCVQDSAKVFGWGYIADFFQSMKEQLPQFEDLLALGKERLGGEKKLEHPFFLPAVGAALRGLREGTLRVNLLPGVRPEGQRRIRYQLNIFLAVLLLIGLIGWSVSYPVKDEFRLRQLRQENEKLEPSVKSLRREEEELNRLRREISSLAALSANKGEILQILDELSRVVPTSAYISSLRYHGEAVELQGSAENSSSLIPLLERSPLFENVKFNAPSNRGRDNRESFSLRAEIERPGQKEPKR